MSARTGTLIELEEEDKMQFDDFVNCISKTRREYSGYQIGVGLAAASIYSPSGSIYQKIYKRSIALLAGYGITSFIISYISFKACVPRFESFVKTLRKKRDEAVSNKSGFASDIPQSAPPTLSDSYVPYSPDLSYPTISSVDTDSLKQNFSEIKANDTPPKKFVTYDDLWKSHHGNAQHTPRKPEEETLLGRPAVEPPTKRVQKNIYGDPVE